MQTKQTQLICNLLPINTCQNNLTSRIYVQIFSLLTVVSHASKQLCQNSRWFYICICAAMQDNRTYLQNRNNLLLINFYLTIHFVKILQKY